MNDKYTLDANTFISAWQADYPPTVFRTLWERLPEFKDRMVFVKPVFDEIDQVPPHHRKLSREERNERYPLRVWLEKCCFDVMELDGDTNNEALRLELKYETKEDSKGASRNDISLVAFAKKEKCAVVTQERNQAQPPQKRCNFKIPLVCKYEGVTHLKFIDFLEKIGVSI